MTFSHLTGLVKTALFNANKSEAKTAENANAIDELTLAQADMLVDVCCMQLGVEKSDLLTQEVENE